MGARRSVDHADTLWIHPVFSTRFYAYYLEGLRRVFPSRRLVVSGVPFGGWIGPRDGMAVIVGGGRRRCGCTFTPRT